MRPIDVAQLLQLRRPEFRPVERVLRSAVTVADLQRAAHRRWPSGVRDYVDGGADGEVSLARNRAAFADHDLLPRALRDVSAVDTGRHLLGAPARLPLVLAPTGYTRMMHAAGEPAVARAAASAGVPYTLSTFATTSVEEVADTAPGGDLWFQLYVWRDRSLVADLLQRAATSGYRVLVLTVDTATTGLRVRDAHNGFTVPPRLTARTVAGMACRPGWAVSMLLGRPITFANLDAVETTDVFGYASSQLDASVTWDDVERIRAAWSGPLVLKGLLDPADVVHAADVGVDGVVLSNHGGRQLDQAISPITVLPRVRDVVGNRIELYVDSGVRHGTDVAIALALGATGCLIGRPYLYGLGAAGERGVARCLEILGGELRRAMQLLGVAQLDQLADEGPALVRRSQPVS